MESLSAFTTPAVVLLRVLLREDEMQRSGKHVPVPARLLQATSRNELILCEHNRNVS